MRILALVAMTATLLSCTSNESAQNTMNVDETLAVENIDVDEADGAKSARQPCEAIEGLLATAEDCQDLGALQKDVKSAPAALDAPPAMVRGKTYEVTLVVDRPKKAAPPPPPPLPPPATQTCPDGSVILATDACPLPPPPPPPPPPSPEGEDGNAMEVVGNDTAVVDNMAEEVQSPTNEAERLPPTASEVVEQLPGKDTPFEAQVGRYMTAELTGSGFKVRLISPSDPMQVIPQGGQGRWLWEVVPQMGGQRRLTVKTQAVGIIDGKPVALGNGDSSQDVVVKVSWPDRIWDLLTGAPAWIKALTAILVALGALIAAWVPIRKWLRNRE